MGDWNTLPIRLSAIELNGGHMTVYIGVDLHKTQFTVHVRIGDKDEDLPEIKQYPTTVAGYTEFLNRILAYKTASFAVKTELNQPRKQTDMMYRQFQSFLQRMCFQKATYAARRLKI